MEELVKTLCRESERCHTHHTHPSHPVRVEQVLNHQWKQGPLLGEGTVIWIYQTVKLLSVNQKLEINPLMEDDVYALYVNILCHLEMKLLSWVKRQSLWMKSTKYMSLNSTDIWSPAPTLPPVSPPATPTCRYFFHLPLQERKTWEAWTKPEVSHWKHSLTGISRQVLG